VGAKFRFSVTVSNPGVTPATDLVAAYVSGDGPCGLEWSPRGDVVDENISRWVVFIEATHPRRAD